MANMAIARQIAEVLGVEPAFTIIGVADKGGAYVQPEEAQLYEVNSRRLLDPREAMTVIARQDCILDIGAGDSFADIYGLKRFLFLWASKMMAVARHVPIMLSPQTIGRSEEHTSELQSLMRISSAVFCLKKKQRQN